MNDIGKTTHVKSETIRKTDLEYYPLVKGIYWRVKKNLFGKVIKEGWFRSYYLSGNGYWYDGVPENCVVRPEGFHIRYKPRVQIRSDSSMLERFFETPKLAKEFYIKFLDDITKNKYVEF